jgi:protein transport protein SEC24
MGSGIKSWFLFKEYFFVLTMARGLGMQFSLQEYDNDLSRRLNEVINEIRRQRCSYLR